MAGRAGSLIGVVWDLGATLGIYYGLRAAGASERVALLAATIVAGSRLVWVALRHRRVTWFGALMLAVFGVNLALTFASGDTRFLLLSDSFVGAAIGLVFLLSARGRPLTLSASQTSQPWRAAELDRLFDNDHDLRRRFVVSAVVWGVGLLVLAVGRVPLVYALPVDVMVGLSVILFWSTIGLLATWSLIYTRAGGYVRECSEVS